MSSNPTCPRCHRGGEQANCDVPGVELWRCTTPHQCHVELFTIEDGEHAVFRTEEEFELQFNTPNDS